MNAKGHSECTTPEPPQIPAAVWWGVFAALSGIATWQVSGDWATAAIVAGAAFLGVPVTAFVRRSRKGGVK
jgi:hypothetical protein